MKDEDRTKEQLIDELVKLRLENSELELSLANQDRLSTASQLPLPVSSFMTGRGESLASRPEQQKAHVPPKYKFSDLVDIPSLQQLLQVFYAATGITHGLQDEDKNLLSGIDWLDICANFHRVCPETECRCRQSDSYIADHLYDGPYVRYKCMNGLMDYATPVIVEGQHLATIFFGQFLHAPPDEDYFRNQAQTYGFDERAYMEALSRVPIISKEQADSIMRFYSELGKFLTTMGLERKRNLEAADQTIKEQDKRLSLILANSPIVAFRQDQDLRYTWVYNPNPGFANENVVGRTDEDLLSQADSEPLTQIKRRVLESGISAREEVSTTIAGEKIYYDLYVEPVRDLSDSLIGINGIAIDITPLKQTELALLQSKQKFSKAFQCSPDIMIITTFNEGNCIEVNDAFTKITGYEREEVIGRSVKDIGIWAVSEERDRMLQQIQDHGSIRDFVLEIKMKSGGVRTLSLSGDKIDIDNKLHLLLSCRDITESKQMEVALRSSEQCFSKAFDTSPVLMAITSLNEGRIIKINDVFCRTLGYSHEELIGRTTFDIGFWINLADRYRVQQCLIRRQPVQDLEMHFYKKTGEQRLGLYSAEFLDVDGEACILGVLTDITELRQMEIEMTRLDRLHLVGEMAASIGHEIRNPMTTVRGYLQLFGEKEEYYQEKGSFDLMIEELDRANLIITEFLSLANNKIVELKPENLNSIIRALWPLLQAKAMSQDQYMKLELNELPELLLDKKEIHQLILNLINNGLESMSTGGEITIATSVENGKVVLAVRDQGHGIDDSLLKNLGMPFITTKEQSAGLGLPVCYRIAARHKARIDIKTGSRGTAILVAFPI